MVVVTGIRTAIKYAPVIYKGLQIVYKAAKKTRQGQQWVARHPKVIRYGTYAATGGTLVYDLLSIDYDSLIGKNPTGYRQQQTRSNLYTSGARQQYKSRSSYQYRRRFCEQRQQYRSRNRF